MTSEELELIRLEWISHPDNKSKADEYMMNNPGSSTLPYIQDPQSGVCKWLSRKERRARGLK